MTASTKPGCWTSRAETLTQTNMSAGHAPRSIQLRRLAAGLAEDPAADRQDRAVLLGDLDELVGHDQAALGMLPADERLDAGEPAGREVDDRLVARARAGRGRRRAGARRSARGARGSPRACPGRRSRSRPCRSPWPCTSRRRRCGRGRPRRPTASRALAMPTEAVTDDVLLADAGTAPAARGRAARPSRVSA